MMGEPARTSTLAPSSSPTTLILVGDTVGVGGHRGSIEVIERLYTVAQSKDRVVNVR